jgi:3-oxoacid CoA-transferase
LFSPPYSPSIHHPPQAENIVEIGEIAPMDVDLPGIYVDRIVPATVEKKIELLTLNESENASSSDDGDKGSESDSSIGSTQSKKDSAHDRRIKIAKRAAKEVCLVILSFIGRQQWLWIGD